MVTVRIQRSPAGFSVDGGEIVALGTAQRRAIDLAVGLVEPASIIVHGADPKTYEFLPGVAPFQWMSFGKTASTRPKR